MPRKRSFLEGLARTPDEVRADNLRDWASHVPEAISIGDVRERNRCRVAGVVTNIRIDPREGSSIEARISDGSGYIIAKWLGRSSMEGIRLGVGLIIEGTPGRGRTSELVMLNPEYRLVTDPEHG